MFCRLFSKHVMIRMVTEAEGGTPEGRHDWNTLLVGSALVDCALLWPRHVKHRYVVDSPKPALARLKILEYRCCFFVLFFVQCDRR